MVTYEAAPAFDAALAVRRSDGTLPLAWFGFYRRVEAVELPAGNAPPSAAWQPEIAHAEYLDAVADIRHALAAGTVRHARRRQLRPRPSGPRRAARRARYTVFCFSNKNLQP